MLTTHPTNLPCIIGTLALVALIFGGQPPEALGADPQAGVDAEQQAIGELVERRLVGAVNARDYEAFRAGLTDDWTYFTSAGRRRDFKAWKEIVSRYTKLQIEVTDVRSRLSKDGRLAWSTFRGRIQGEVDGEVDDRKLLYTAIFKKTDNEWKLRHLHGTASSESR